MRIIIKITQKIKLKKEKERGEKRKKKGEKKKRLYTINFLNK